MSKIYQHPDFITPDSIAIQNSDGTITSGSVTSIQTMLETAGTPILQIDETNGSTPGTDLHVEFVNVKELYGIVARAYYSGGTATHEYELKLRNWSGATDDTFVHFDYGEDVYDVRTLFIPTDIAGNYINTGGNLGDVQMTFYHGNQGGANHPFYIDYVALLGRRFA